MRILQGQPPASATALLLLFALLGSAPAGAQSAAAEVQFDVWEIAVTGNSRLDNRAIEAAVYPFLGPGRTVGDMERARQALETRYREAGFGTVVVTIPEQDVEEGLVTLAVLEGRVDRLLVTGARYFSPAQIRAATPSLAPGNVPLLPEVQQELLDLNSATSDRRITPVLRPGREPGTLEAELKVEDRLPVHGSLEVTNRYTRDTTRTRLTGTLSYNNLWQRQHGATLGYQTAPENRDDVEVFFGTYSARITGTPWLVSGYLVDSDTNVATVGTLGVLGQGRIAGLRLIRALPPLGNGFQRVTLGLDYKDFQESIALTGSQPTIETPIAYGVLSAAWGLSLPGADSSGDLSLVATVGPRFLGNDAGEFADKRAGSRPSFAHLGLAATHERLLGADFRLRAALGAQLADSPLISNEQFSFGGATTVRGYLDSQQFADDGAAVQVELLLPDWGRRLPGVDSGRLLAFVDAGGGRLRDPLPEQDSRFFLWSAGLGLRATLWERLDAGLEWAYPLEDSGDGSVESGDARWHFSTRLGF